MRFPHLDFYLHKIFLIAAAMGTLNIPTYPLLLDLSAQRFKSVTMFSIFKMFSKKPKKDTKMSVTLPALPYADTALEPHIPANTLSFHYGKHHKAYVDNLNKMIDGTDLANASLEEIVNAAAGDASKAGLFNNAAQVWNHTFYWHSMKPGGGGAPTGLPPHDEGLE